MDQRILENYQKELSKNNSDLDKSKKEIILEIKKWNKDEILKKDTIKYSLWMRIKRALGF